MDDHTDEVNMSSFMSHVERLSLNSSKYDRALCQGALVKVDLSPSSKLDHAEAIREARSIVEQGGVILWEIEWDLLSKKNAFFLESYLSIFERAIKIFVGDLPEDILKNSYGAVLLKSPVDLSYVFPFNPIMEDYFFEWLDHTYQTPSRLFETASGLNSFKQIALEVFEITSWGKHLKNLHALNTLSDYLHRLGSFFPDHFQLFATMDHRMTTSFSKLFQGLSKHRFSHVTPTLSTPHPLNQAFELPFFDKGYLYLNQAEKNDITLGICFPQDEQCLHSSLLKIDEIAEELKEKGIAFKVIPESMMTQKWDGLSDMMYFSSTLTNPGRRMLQGFAAAGGRGVFVGESCHLIDEISYEAFLKGSG